MSERTGEVTMKGNPVTLEGKRPAVGQPAPDFRVVGEGLKPVKLSDFRGRTVVISAVPSLDTPTCDVETRRFNQEAAGLGDGVVILTVSMDLPFAQKRWCGAAGVDRVVTVSDYQQADFGRKYGVLIKDLRLLARACFVVDAAGKLVYEQVVREIAKEPDYAAVLVAARAARTSGTSGAAGTAK